MNISSPAPLVGVLLPVTCIPLIDVTPVTPLINNLADPDATKSNLWTSGKFKPVSTSGPLIVGAAFVP